MIRHIPTPGEVRAIAETVLADRYAGASGAFVAGSLMRGEGTITSDIDLIILFPELAQARRESFLVNGVPVEAFVHDSDTLRWFVREDVRSGRPALLGMLSEGQIIGAEPTNAETWKFEADKLLQLGPMPLTAEQIDRLRYQITDNIDDIRGARNIFELAATGVALHSPLAELILRGRGYWSGSGKWLPRMLRKLDVEIAERFESAFERLFRDGNADSLIEFSESELTRHGGPLFDGYRSDAPADWRLS